MKENVIKEKSKKFAIRIVNLNNVLKGRKEFVLSAQVLRSGTSIGANVSESEYAQSGADFLNKINIALKEANETIYWLDLLKEGNHISKFEHSSLYKDCEEIVKILVSIVKTQKQNLMK